MCPRVILNSSHFAYDAGEATLPKFTRDQQPRPFLDLQVFSQPTANTMADNLVEALEKVHISSKGPDTNGDDWIDHIFHEQRPRKRVKQDPQELKNELREKYLTASTTFPTEWLNKLQQ